MASVARKGLFRCRGDRRRWLSEVSGGGGAREGLSGGCNARVSSLLFCTENVLG
ncbi:hypothetical protein E1A91_A06G189700v1 [Gossypium mustelinum]|uniref:Uncharacterized protein n=1 Tax=Gossypium mustelinum TaxID=34275 RepID=A0A5D2YXS2_GOSMU|nr:hypothetical protein E1A91_A06G189700v1 [Gossypium mustelinum]